MGIFDDLAGIVGDVARVVIAPVEIAADLARAVTKPIAETAQEAVDAMKDMTKG